MPTVAAGRAAIAGELPSSRRAASPPFSTTVSSRASDVRSPAHAASSSRPGAPVWPGPPGSFTGSGYSSPASESSTTEVMPGTRSMMIRSTPALQRLGGHRAGAAGAQQFHVHHAVGVEFLEDDVTAVALQDAGRMRSIASRTAVSRSAGESSVSVAIGV